MRPVPGRSLYAGDILEHRCSYIVVVSEQLLAPLASQPSSKFLNSPRGGRYAGNWTSRGERGRMIDIYDRWALA
jgi:hypothetical protein